MTFPLIKSTAVAALFAIGSCTAQAGTITFDELTASDSNYLSSGATFTTNGYQFTVTSGLAWLLNGTPLSGYAGNGTTSLDVGGIVRMTNPNGNVFSVTSIDLATVLPAQPSIIKFTGTAASGATTTRSYPMQGATGIGPFGLTTTPLSGFDNLVAFDMQVVYNTGATTYFSLVDNIQVDDMGANVPEPTTWAMLGLGLAILTGTRRRRAR